MGDGTMFGRAMRAGALSLLLLASTAVQAAEIGGFEAAKYEVRKERSVLIPMRDGTHQAANIYFPIGATGKLPVLLMRSPYGKDVLIKRHDDILNGFAS